MKTALSLIMVMTLTLLASQNVKANEDPCAEEWETFQIELANAGGNFRDPTVLAAIRALRICRLSNGV